MSAESPPPDDVEIDAGQRVSLATGIAHRVKLRGPELHVRLPIDPADAEHRDDEFELKSDDGAYHQTKTVKDDKQPGDAFLDLVYTDILRDRSYTLTVVEHDGHDPYPIFERVPYEQLPGLRPEDVRRKRRSRA